MSRLVLHHIPGLDAGAAQQTAAAVPVAPMPPLAELPSTVCSASDPAAPELVLVRRAVAVQRVIAVAVGPIGCTASRAALITDRDEDSLSARTRVRVRHAADRLDAANRPVLRRLYLDGRRLPAACTAYSRPVTPLAPSRHPLLAVTFRRVVARVGSCTNGCSDSSGAVA
jgi:hypothetical protein